MTSPAPGSICLSMIVRDEAEVVTTALGCVAPHIDYWVVVDTGSTDGTVDVVEGFFAAAGIPGELHRRPWRDFGHNRTEALDLCRGRAEYAWVIDADDRVVGALPLDRLDADCYQLRYGPHPTYWREQLFRLSLGWRYEGPVHEYATSVEPCRAVRLGGDYHVESRRLGARGRARDTYERDTQLLLAALEREPGHPRWTFYLAQSLFDAGDHRAALEWYSRRSELGGWEEEIFYALLRRAECLHLLGARWKEIERAYSRCWRSRAHRAEPLLELARGRRLRGDLEDAYAFARQANDLPFPEEDALFVAADVYAWRSADELAYCALRTGRVAESVDAWDEALRSGAAPAREQERMERNLAFAKALMARRGGAPAA
jgi:glycosyltransferase involved in cell wall biosynthesis